MLVSFIKRNMYAHSSTCKKWQVELKVRKLHYSHISSKQFRVRYSYYTSWVCLYVIFKQVKLLILNSFLHSLKLFNKFFSYKQTGTFTMHCSSAKAQVTRQFTDLNSFQWLNFKLHIRRDKLIISSIVSSFKEWSICVFQISYSLCNFVILIILH